MIISKLKQFIITLFLKNLKEKRQSNMQGIKAKRLMLEEVSKRFKGRKVAVKNVSTNGIPCLFFSKSIDKSNTYTPIIMYLHGGAYTTGSIHSHRAICERICDIWQVNVLSVDYRLAPEHPFPAAADDAISAYLWLTANYPQSKINIVGDSAGGGLALTVCKKLIEDKERKPSALILFAPWVNLSCNSTKMHEMAKKDPVLSREELIDFAKMYASKYPLNHPYISPIHLEFSRFPPVFIQTGKRDLLLDDSEKLYKKLIEAGVQAELDVWENMWHVFQLFSMIPQADKALRIASGKIMR